MRKEGAMENSRNHQMPHWTVWLSVVLLLLGCGLVLNVFIKPPPQKMEDTIEVRNSTEQSEIGIKKKEMQQKVESIQEEKKELQKREVQYENKVEREQIKINVLHKQGKQNQKSVSVMSTMELYDFFARVNTQNNCGER